MFRTNVKEVFRDLDCFVELSGPKQGVGQLAVRRNRLWVARGELPQVYGRVTVIRHVEQKKAAQLPGFLVVRIDAQRPVDQFQGTIQLSLRRMESGRREQRARFRRRKLNDVPCAGFRVRDAPKADEALSDLLDTVPVVWLRFEHCFGIGDRLLEALKA